MFTSQLLQIEFCNFDMFLISSECTSHVFNGRYVSSSAINIIGKTNYRKIEFGIPNYYKTGMLLETLSKDSEHAELFKEN